MAQKSLEAELRAGLQNAIEKFLLLDLPPTVQLFDWKAISDDFPKFTASPFGTVEGEPKKVG